MSKAARESNMSYGEYVARMDFVLYEILDLIKQYLDIAETLYFRGIELDKSIKIGKSLC